MFKKLFIGLGVIVGLFILAIILVPLFFDANKLKPQIKQVVEQNLNADFNIGNLKLSLWGGVNFQISEMTLSEKGGKPIFAMKDAKLALPYSSILGGRPDVTLVVQNPEINIVNELDGKMNVLKITKPSTAKPEESKTGDAGKAAGAAAGLAFDLGFKISDGHVVYFDQKKNTKTELRGLDLEIKKFGINQPFSIFLKTDFNSKEMKDLVLKGPMVLKGSAAIYIKPEGLDRFDLNANGDLSGLVIKYGDLFNKKADVPLKFLVDISASDKFLKMKEVKFIANDASVGLRGAVENFSDPNMNIEITSSKFIFDHWQDILKPLKDFDFKGTAQLGLKVSGTMERLSYNGKANLNGASLRAPGIVPRVTDLKATLDFSNDTVTLSNAGLKMGASDLAFTGTVKNFSKPIVVFNLNSQNFNVDSLLPQKTPEQARAEEKAAAAASAKSGDSMSDAQIEAAVVGPIVLMKKNPVMRGLDFTARANMKKITVHKADITNLNAEVNFKNMMMVLKKASAQAFNGSANFNSTIDFKGVDPAYQISGDVSGVDINAAITNQMPIAKDTLFGKTYGKVNLSGVGITKAKVRSALKGTIKAEIKNGSWSSLTAMKQIGEKLSSLPGDLKNQVGGVNITDRFRQLKVDMNVGGGRFNITNMVADMEGPNTTVNGQGWVDFDMNNEIGGRIIVQGKANIPYDIGCKITSPCLKLDRFVKEQVKEQGGKAIKKAIEKIDNPQVRDLLKKLPF